MNKVKSSFFTSMMIYVILFGFMNMISPLEIERSKWDSLQEWLGSEATSQSEKDTVPVSSISSWSDYHSSQTATHVVVKSDQVNKLTSFVQRTDLYAPELHFYVIRTQECAPKENVPAIKPLSSGIAIGAP